MFVPCSLLVFLFLQVLHGRGGGAADNITASTPLLANQTLLSSPGQIFQLGFFTPNGSQNLYVGIWFKKPGPSRVVWVANRDKPISTSDRSSASLGIGADGNLNLLDGQGNTVWSTNVSAKNQSFASISDGGNFALWDGSSNELWGSFGDPCDTFLPGMKFGVISRTGVKQYLTAWRSEDDPSPGAFVSGLTPETPTQMVTWDGPKLYWRSGQWDKVTFIGIPGMNQNYLNGLTITQDINQGTVYLTYQPYDTSLYQFMYISPTGALTTTLWDKKAMTWTKEREAPVDRCNVYGTCGPFGVCNVNKSPICSCLEGFLPSSFDEWKNENWSRGCVRQTALNCELPVNSSSSDKLKTDSFLHLSNMKLPDLAYFQVGIQDAGVCQDQCLSNCSCLAYSYVNSIGCMTWSGELLDIQDFMSNYEEDLYVRLTSVGRSEQLNTLIISLTSVFVAILFGGVMLLWWKRRLKQSGRPRKDTTPLDSIIRSDGLKPEGMAELPTYSFASIALATNNFDIANKLGQGGFGSVYKGKLSDGQVVAVKRLASSSSQGIEEFKNEVILISKLQHRNLIRLVGLCSEREEKILLYEYLPNKSLDVFLFDMERKGKLNWSTRFRIIMGVARGLLYLHKDSSLRIIHRDLKVSNILLDDKMNPKISDFGLARMFEGTRDLRNTRRVVGTLGYMPPEYAIGGVFSEKSDVYSFGVLLLEIVSGKKNTSICLVEDHINLPSYAWMLWSEDRGMDLIEDELGEFSVVEMMRCIQVGLLCVQDEAIDRPNMTAVVLMLSGESELPQPKRPAFMFQCIKLQANQSCIQSTNSMTNSTLQEGR